MNAFFPIVVGGLDIFQLIVLYRMLLEFTMSVLYRRNLVQEGAGSVTTFHRIRIGKLELCVKDYSPCSFLRELFILVLCVHMVLAK